MEMNLQQMQYNFLHYVKINLSDGTYRCYKNHLDYTIKYFNENKIL